MTEVSLTLFGKAPWGFRVGGGHEFKQPLVVTRVSPGSLACKSGVQVGDQVKAVNGQFTNNWTQAQLNQSVSSASSLHLVLARNGGAGATTSGYQAPTVGQNNTATGGASFAQHTQNPKINASAKGFGASQPAYRPLSRTGDLESTASNIRSAASTGQVKFEGDMTNTTFSTNTYNNPLSLYSNANVIDTINAQSNLAGFGPTVAGSPSGGSPVPPKSAVLKAVQGQKQAYKPPQTKSFNYL